MENKSVGFCPPSYGKGNADSCWENNDRLEQRGNPHPKWLKKVPTKKAGAITPAFLG